MDPLLLSDNSVVGAGWGLVGVSRASLPPTRCQERHPPDVGPNCSDAAKGPLGLESALAVTLGLDIHSVQPRTTAPGPPWVCRNWLGTHGRRRAQL